MSILYTVQIKAYESEYISLFPHKMERFYLLNKNKIKLSSQQLPMKSGESLGAPGCFNYLKIRLLAVKPK